MKMLNSIASLAALSVLAGMLAWPTPAAAQSGSFLGLPGVAADGHAAARRVTPTAPPPPTGDGWPFRQFVFAQCPPEITPVCTHRFLQVPANRFFEIRSISCTGTAGPTTPRHYILMNTDNIAQLATAAMAIIPPSQVQDIDGVLQTYADSSGPYYFTSGERVFLLGAGGNTGGGCGISGYLYPTN